MATLANVNIQHVAMPCDMTRCHSSKHNILECLTPSHQISLGDAHAHM